MFKIKYRLFYAENLLKIDYRGRSAAAAVALQENLLIFVYCILYLLVSSCIHKSQEYFYLHGLVLLGTQLFVELLCIND